MDAAALIQKLDKIDQLARSVKLKRLMNAPLRYTKGIFWKEIVYPITHRGSQQIATTFFDAKMEVLLPSGMDLYLLGAKSHDSEIRLAKWMILNISSSKVLIDVGAHFGYFSQLAAHLVGSKGKVFALEAAPSTFSILKKNIASLENVAAQHIAISDRKEALTFYEFPTLYSEYNTLDTAQFVSSKWYKENPPTPVTVQATTLDHFCQQHQIQPDFIKLDIEGAEAKALKGMHNYLTHAQPIVLMEFSLTNLRLHEEALDWMRSLDYRVFSIQKEGNIQPLTQPVDYLTQQKLSSDNFVLQKV